MAYEFQDKILQKIRSLRSVALFLPPGAGKTRIACLWSNYQNPGLRLVVCPNEAVPVWQDEIQKWLAQPSISLADQPRARKIEYIKNLPPRGWLIIPYQSFRSVAAHRFGQDPPAVVILDESHAIQSPKAQVTKAVHTWLAGAQSKAILSGTPFGNSYLDIWAQWYFLDKGRALGRSFFQFRYQNFEPDHMGWNWTIKQKSKVLINKTIRESGVVMSEDDIDLPPRTYGIRYADQTPWQKKHLSTLMDEFAIYFPDGAPAVMTQWIIVRIMKMRQICSGFFKDEDHKIHEGQSEKYKILSTILEEEQDHKIVIWCAFRHEIHTVADLLRKKAIGNVVYKGGMQTNERKANVTAFQTDKRIRCFVGQIAAGGQAITLTAADRVVYFSNSYSVRQRIQSEKRTHRIGSEKYNRIHYTDILTRGTLEQTIHNALMDRQMKNDMVLLRHLLKKMVKY